MFTHKASYISVEQRQKKPKSPKTRWMHDQTNQLYKWMTQLKNMHHNTDPLDDLYG